MGVDDVNNERGINRDVRCKMQDARCKMQGILKPKKREALASRFLVYRPVNYLTNSTPNLMSPLRVSNIASRALASNALISP